MKVKEIITYLESSVPLSLQESYDNCGLIAGNKEQEVSGVLLCVDATEEVIKEAERNKCNMIISHHPILFIPIKKLTGATYVERTIIAAIKQDICIYAMHTNLDNLGTGVNRKIAEKIGLKGLQVLSPMKGVLKKLVTYCPVSHAEEVRTAIFKAGAGVIGNYDECSFNAGGTGTFKPGKGTKPFSGSRGKRHFEDEMRIETILPSYRMQDVVNALLESHPYEEVAYDVYLLDNTNPQMGAGMTGELPKPLKDKSFLDMLKMNMNLRCIRHTPFLNKPIKKVAICGGAGSFLLQQAIKSGAQALVTADFTYHRFFDAEDKILIADIGHYESERFTPEIIYELLTKKFTNFAPLISNVNTNPINYY